MEIRDLGKFPGEEVGVLQILLKKRDEEETIQLRLELDFEE